MDLSEADPKGLIRESYRIEGITAGECRSIFVDWALSLPTGVGFADHARLLLSIYGTDALAHPMTQVLTEALEAPEAPRRRGGRRLTFPPADFTILCALQADARSKRGERRSHRSRRHRSGIPAQCCNRSRWRAFRRRS